MRMLVILALAVLAVSARAQKIYINPSDQIHNWSPDKTYCEADGMQDVARRLEAKLKARGFDVRNSNGATMKESVDAANAWPADIFISLHSNAAGSQNSGKAHGTNTLFFFPRDGREPNPISIKLAVICDEKVVEKMTTYGRGHDFAVTPDYPFLPYNLYVLRKTEMPGTLVEGLFHDNEEDVAVLKTEEGRDAYAQGVYEAICDHFGWSYYPAAPTPDASGPVANDSDGNLALVMRSREGTAQIIRQFGVNARWSENWSDLGGDIDGEPSVGRNAQGRLQVFAVSGGRVWHKVQSRAGSDRWNGWYDLGGRASDSPAVARMADGRLVVFAVGADGILRSRAQRSAESALQWSGWHELGGLSGLSAVAAQADGRLVVAAVTGDCKLKWTVQAPDMRWEKWRDLEGDGFGMRALVLDQKGRLALFAKGPGDRVMLRVQNSPNADEWDAWQDLGVPYANGLAAARSGDGRIEVFGLDAACALFHASQNPDGQWSDWQALPGVEVSGLAVGRNNDGRVEVFAQNKAGKWMYRIQREPGKSAIWDGWYTVGEYFKAKVREYPTSK